jgi:D-alanyl-D-alanine carboxypeptidase
MKKITFLSLFLLICGFFHTNSCLSFTKETDQKLHTTVQNIMDEYNIPGAVVGVWIPGEGEWVQAFGFANKEKKEKMKIEDRFAIRGLPYTLVMIGFLKLLDEGKVSLDDKLSKYLKDVPNDDKITLGYLLSEKTDLLPSVKGYPIPKKASTTVAEFKERLAKEKPHRIQEYVDTGLGPHEEGKRYVYSIMLLSLVIEKVSGMSLEKYFEQNIFAPLKLHHTSLPSDYAKIPQPYAHGYLKVKYGDVVSEVDVSNGNPYTSLDAAVSNLPDLKILAQAIGSGSLLKKDSFQRMEKWTDWSFNTKKGLELILDNGWIEPMVEVFGGYDAVVAYLPAKKAVLVCLTNTGTQIEKNGMVMTSARLIAREVLGLLDLPLISDLGVPVKDFPTGPDWIIEKGKSK